MMAEQNLTEKNTEPTSTVVSLEQAAQLEEEKTGPKSVEWITIHLPSTLTLINLPALQAQLQQHLGERIQLSGAQVEQVDTPSLQLLLAFKKLEDTPIHWLDTSEKLAKAIHLLGLTEALGLPVGK